MQDAIDHLAPMTEGRQVTFQLVFPHEGGQITGDRFYWDQIFTNLIENALKENPQPGLVITVSGKWDTEGRCVVQVRDNGTGIPTDTIDKVFDPFFTTKTVGRGAGLGLSMARDVISRHGGIIQAESRSGRGSTFTLMLPLA